MESEVEASADSEAPASEDQTAAEANRYPELTQLYLENEDAPAYIEFDTDYHLYDSRVEGMEGGSGRSRDWSLVMKRRSKVPLVLSGGLTPENVGEGIAAVSPYAVDVASGTEASPGVKDPGKLRAFLEAAQGVRA